MRKAMSLIACVSQKTSVLPRGRQLCTSDWFRKASAYAARRAWAAHVLHDLREGERQGRVN
jgi:hypothetical protein